MTQGTFAHGFAPMTVTLPRCPSCGSTASRCKRPSEHQATEWHVAREALLAELFGWRGWDGKSLTYVIPDTCICGCGGGMPLDPEKAGTLGNT